ncbi:hypothetical protein KM472_gp161 [Cynomolgus macaque cytomegalovirus strain Ottawa]|uniref:Uncharacterized protein n=1 Tax=macacine betaherpesvirus 8 TaxID=2560567 RepID=G8H0P0_9BETA|nr:hypothetical protein KM472_gp161 [Cynomolgus macaque cytomegalovirus strain Ottawa]AEQ32238.1 hypothetical protein cy154 [Cynomolgus macaque cytomegalovirus strain Ottawa]
MRRRFARRWPKSSQTYLISTSVPCHIRRSRHRTCRCTIISQSSSHRHAMGGNEVAAVDRRHERQGQQHHRRQYQHTHRFHHHQHRNNRLYYQYVNPLTSFQPSYHEYHYIEPINQIVHFQHQHNNNNHWHRISNHTQEQHIGYLKSRQQYQHKYQTLYDQY